MTNPVVDLIGDRTGRIVPIYPQSEKAQITTWELAGWVENALERCRPRGIADPVPDAVRRRLGLIDRGAALHDIHLPETIDEKERARRRLAFDELLRVQLVLVHAQAGDGARRPSASATTSAASWCAASTPRCRFPLTGAQQRVIAEIDADLAAPHPMHRLLQGDVGVRQDGRRRDRAARRRAGRAPGRADGADRGARRAARRRRASAARRAARCRAGEPVRRAPAPRRAADQPGHRQPSGGACSPGSPTATVDLVIGTHALIQEGVGVPQPRRGRRRRAAPLRRRAAGRAAREGRRAAVPDVLVMTATPIPRTAAMTVYGDLDVSVLDELPPGRTPIVTRWAGGPLLEARGVGRRARRGRGRPPGLRRVPADRGEREAGGGVGRGDVRAAGGRRAGRAAARAAARADDVGREGADDGAASAAGDLDVLVATTVIEVGVDVPNATVMVILDADRFGIAQLHQLRGRVGRGRPRVAVLAGDGRTEPTAPAPSPRVEALVASTDGFELAEVDLDLRGEGTLMSSAQKGRSDLRLASLRRDRELVELAREAAFEIVDADPTLAHDTRPARRAGPPAHRRGRRSSSPAADVRPGGLGVGRLAAWLGVAVTRTGSPASVAVVDSSSSSRTMSQRSRQSSQR